MSAKLNPNGWLFTLDQHAYAKRKAEPKPVVGDYCVWFPPAAPEVGA